jgi:protease IV
MSSAAHASRVARVVLLSAVGTVVAVGATGCASPGGYKITPIPADKTLDETVIIREPGLGVIDKIAIVDVDGLISNAPKRGLLTEGDNPVSLLTEKLNRASQDKNVKAVLLRINSPGGGVTATRLMYEEILNYKKQTGRPVIAMMLDMAASGGYYIACACDEIIAHPTTVTGSIGVIMMTFDLSGALQKLYIKPNVFKSGPRKDSGSPFREMTEADKEIFTGIVNDFYEGFLKVVQANRTKLSPEQVRKLADGRIYSASDALENGLVDRVATMRQAMAIAKERAGIKKAKVIVYHRPLGWVPTAYAAAPIAQPSTVNLINVNLPEWLRPSTPQFMYLWVPGR